MLFGRKKPGFADSFGDGNVENKDDHANIENKEKANEIEKVDLTDYLDQKYQENQETEVSQETQEVEKVDDRRKVEILADFIRARSNGSYLTSKTFLKEEENLGELLKELKEEENFQDIVAIEGDEDIYFYSSENMSDNYAMIALFVKEKNLPKTIAEMVRWNAKTYPCPTPIDYFKRTPYDYSNQQIENAVDLIKKEKEYEDIGELRTGNHVRYLYSTLHMSEKYARALAESVEYGEYGYL